MKSTMKITLTVITMLLLGASWLYMRVPTSGISDFNKWYKTDLSDRKIVYAEGGFVDNEFCAKIPMNEDEFNRIKETIGMQVTTKAPQCNRLNWCELPPESYYVLDRLKDNNYRDRIEGHFNHTQKVAYFSYFNH